VRLVVKPQL